MKYLVIAAFYLLIGSVNGQTKTDTIVRVLASDQNGTTSTYYKSVPKEKLELLKAGVYLKKSANNFMGAGGLGLLGGLSTAFGIQSIGVKYKQTAAWASGGFYIGAIFCSGLGIYYLHEAGEHLQIYVAPGTAGFKITF
jgi:hypothetical protein